MTNRLFGEVLEEVFSILELTEEEKKQAAETFKKRLAFNVLRSVQSELPLEQRDWIDQNSSNTTTADNQKLTEIRSAISELYTPEELFEKSKPIFRSLLEDYIKFMSPDLSEEEVSQLNAVVANRL